jgi:hypothetical protein
MPTINLKKKLFIASTIILFVVTLVFISVIIPRIRMIRSLHSTIFDTHKRVEQEHEKTRHARKSLRELKNATAFAKSIEQSTLAPGQELAVITQLEKISEKYHIEQTINISLDTVSENTVLPSALLQRLGIEEYYTISLLNKGTFENHMAYLHSIETLPYYVVIDALQWERRKTKDEEQPLVSLRLDGYIFISSIKK